MAHVRDRGLDGLSDKTTANHKPILAGMCLVVIWLWLFHSPQAYGFESALWQASMLRKMIYDRLHMDIKPRTLGGYATADELLVPQAQTGAAQFCHCRRM